MHKIERFSVLVILKTLEGYQNRGNAFSEKNRLLHHVGYQPNLGIFKRQVHQPNNPRPPSEPILYIHIF